MYYSMFLHSFIILCMGCNIALIEFKTPPELACTAKWSVELLEKYFVGNDYYQYYSNCGYCLNSNCKAYMKSQ